LGSSFGWVVDAEGPADAAPDEARWRPQFQNGDEMGVLIYIVLTVLIFGVLGLVQKLVEGL
jgi:hypothetical protein